MSDFEIVVERQIDPNDGSVIPVYMYQGKKCRTVDLDHPLAKTLVGYHLIVEDLYQARGWLQQAYDLLPERPTPYADETPGQDYYLPTDAGENDPIIRSLFFSSLIFYGKCFTAASNGRGLKLEQRDSVAADLLSKHEEIMNLRHNLAAHSGDSKFDSGTVRVVLAPQRGDTRFQVRVETKMLNFFDDRGHSDSYSKLIEHVMGHAINKLTDVTNTMTKRVEQGDPSLIAKK